MNDLLLNLKVKNDVNLDLGFLQYFNLSASYSFVILTIIIKLKIKKIMKLCIIGNFTLILKNTNYKIESTEQKRPILYVCKS